MAEQFSMPSMFDTRYAMDRQMQTDAHAAGIAGGGGKRYGMYYNSSLLGDRDNASLMSLTGMMGGQGDPRIAKQNAIDTIMQQYPNPESVEDFKAIGNALRSSGLYNEAAIADKMANDITSSAPARKTIQGADGYKYYIDDGSRVLPGVNKPPVAETFGTIELQTTNEQGKNVTEMWQTSSNGKIIGEKPLASQITSKEPGFDDKIDEAVLEGYITTETQKLVNEKSAPMNNATRLSQEEIVATGIANGKREYNRVENAPAAGSQSAFSERLAVWDSSTVGRRKELTEAGFFDGDNMEIVIKNAISSEGEPAYNKKAGELMAQADIDLAASLEPTMRTLRNTNEVFKTLDSGGITTGIGAKLFTNAKRVGNQIMKALGQEDLIDSDVSDDQYLEALLGSQVFAMIKTLGIGARGLDTPAERNFLIEVMTGTREMDAEAIKRLTRLRREIATDAIQQWNKKVQNGSLDNYIILNRKLKDDGSDQFKAKFAQAKNDFIQEVPEMYQGTWDRPVKHEIVVWDGKDTEYFSWGGRYYNSENREISIDDLNKILNPKGGQ